MGNRNTRPIELSRRNLLNAAVAGLSALFTGCFHPKKFPFPANCRAIPPNPAANSPRLIVDAHCHLFNGSDLQAKEFLSKVEFPVDGLAGEAVAAVGEVLQSIAWNTAPTGEQELRMLKRLAACRNGDLFTKQDLADRRTEGHDRGMKALRASKPLREMRNRRNLRQPPPAPVPVASEGTLSETAVGSKSGRGLTREDVMNQFNELLDPQFVLPPPAPNLELNGLSPALQPAGKRPNVNVAGVIAYIKQNFQYRYVMVDDYLNTFMAKNNHAIDLLVASLVDYDWWLADGKPTKTSLSTQVEVMEQISILKQGQVHGLVAFDPLREVAFQDDKRTGNFSSLALVMKAVEQQGFVGVKLYPPMGFAPWGNADIKTPAFWTGFDLPSWLNQVNLGQRLDDVLKQFYLWCIAKDVPVMAHSSVSNGIAPKFKQLAAAKYWCAALQEFHNLRISFGHMGDFSDTLDGEPNEAKAFLNLMNEAENAPGVHAFADTGYFSELIGRKDDMLNRLRTFYAKSAAGKAPLADRFMYGTDWNLLINEGNISAYFDDWVEIFARLDQPATGKGLTASQRFFGFNALEWLGLRTGQGRDRILAFYKTNQIATPTWLTKLDAQLRPEITT